MNYKIIHLSTYSININTYHQQSQNNFNNDVAKSAFLGIPHEIESFVCSPEFTTNGALVKVWLRDKENNIWLAKGASKSRDGTIGVEQYGEYYAAQIAKVMNLPHIDYDLVEYEDKIVSVCKLFTNQKYGYLPIHALIKEKYCKQSYKQSFIEGVGEVYGKENYEDLLVFDAIICNSDRHLGNFGMLFKNDTNEIVDPAPIFDNGNSIFELTNRDKTPSYVFKNLESFGGITFEKQLKRFLRPRHITMMERLRDFRFERHRLYNIQDSKLEDIEKHIQKVAKEILDYSANFKRDLF